jgi:hypothetical protein
MDNGERAKIEAEMLERVKREYRWWCGKGDFCAYLDSLSSGARTPEDILDDVLRNQKAFASAPNYKP